MTDENKETKIFYICDKRKCSTCRSELDNNGCSHTADISHAKNFSRINDAYFEHEASPIDTGIEELKEIILQQHSITGGKTHES